MAQTVIGIFENANEANDAVAALVSKGFDRSSIDLSTSAGNTTGSSTTGSSTTGTSSTGTSLSGSDAGYANNAGYGSSSQLGHEEGESKVGKFFKSLFGGDDDNDDTYSTYSKAASGRSIVTVHARSSEEAEDAADILDDYGAINTSENSQAYNASASSTTDQATGTNTSIPIIEEQLQVGKKTVETGGVRLRSRIVERPVEENLRLREERVYVDRQTVNRPVTGTELENFREGTIELTESAEVPVVAKEAYVKEEVRVGKEVSERDETIRDTVRSTEVEVENLKTDKSDSSYTSNTGTTNTGTSSSGTSTSGSGSL